MLRLTLKVEGENIVLVGKSGKKLCIGKKNGVETFFPSEISKLQKEMASDTLK